MNIWLYFLAHVHVNERSVSYIISIHGRKRSRIQRGVVGFAYFIRFLDFWFCIAFTAFGFGNIR
jgi:hypothetical protein